MTRLGWLAIAAVLWAPPAGWGQTAPAPPAAGGTWFAAPPKAQGLATVDMSHPAPAQESVTILAKRPSRSWRSPPAEGPSPIASDITHRPWSNKSFTPAVPYCNSALRDVGGQPAKGAGDTMAGVGAGAC
jgi:hypothetical protein